MIDGRVVELEIDKAAVDGHPRTQYRIHTVQTAMANFLSTIDQTGKCLASVKLDLEPKDYILGQLAIAGSLLRGHSTSPIHCSVAASIDDFLSLCCRRITASVSSTANLTLGRQWTFLLSVSPSAKCCSSDNHTSYSSHCKCCPSDSHSLYASHDVSGLSPGMTESLSLVVYSSVEVSLAVETALIYSPVNQLDTATKQISVPLAAQVFDVLDFVRLALLLPKQLHSNRHVSFTPECQRLQKLCRPQIRDNTDPMSVDEIESQIRSTASVKEHVISLCASKPSNMPGTGA